MPAPFLWGAATSAHQVEGNNLHNDWWQWEQSRPLALRSGRACDHYQRFRDDFSLAKKLGHNAHRLSLEWSRIELHDNDWNETALIHYRHVLQALKEQGLASFVTLHHFTNPQWFAARGGWQSPHAARDFAQYVEVVVAKLGSLVDYWVTINEPLVYATQSYWHKRWPPQRRSLKATLTVIRHLAAAHTLAYRIIHQHIPDARVGFAHSVIGFYPASPPDWKDRAVTSIYNWWYNHRFLNVTAGHHDFLGLNYYFGVTKQFSPAFPFARDAAWTGPTSDLNWPIRPNALTDILVDMKRYKLPIFITENGIADATDTKRSDFIRSHIRAIEKAQARGSDVCGYLHWSLLDNFEWADGFKPRFGLVAIDHATQERTPRPSAYVYKAIIEQSQQR